MTSVQTHNKPVDILKLLGINNIIYNTRRDTCRKYKKAKPNLTPNIYSVSLDIEIIGIYPSIYIYGENFLPGGVTTVYFGNTNVSITYYNSNTISFILPVITVPGVYNIVVKNNITLKAINVTGVSNVITTVSNAAPFRII